MKRLIRAFVVTILGLSAFSCYDDSSIREILDDQENRLNDLELLCNEMNSNITALQTLVQAIEDSDYVKSVVPVLEGNVEVGYTVNFAKYGSVTIYNGKDADPAPLVGVSKSLDGIYYWTLGGEYILDESGKKIPVTGANGTNGEDGVTPQLKVLNNVWYVSYDGGVEWTKIGAVPAGNADCLFKNVYTDAGYVCFELTSGVTFKLPLNSASASNLDIVFDVAQGVAMVPGGAYRVNYTIVGGDEDNLVRVLPTSNYVTVYVHRNTATTGYFLVSIDSAFYGIDDTDREDGLIFGSDDFVTNEETYHSQLYFQVSVSDGKNNCITKTLNITEGLLEVESVVVGSEANQVTVQVRTNADYKVCVASECDWITYIPATKAQLRTDILAFSILANETGEQRTGEVYLMNDFGSILETIYFVQYPDGLDPSLAPNIKIDGNFSEWDNALIPESKCADDAWYLGLKTMKAVNVDGFLNLYVELDFKELNDLEYSRGNPFDIFLSSNPETGGYSLWSDMCVDHLIEIWILSPDAELYDRTYTDVYCWTGEIHGDEWSWGEAGIVINYEVARVGDKCEMSIDLTNLPFSYNYQTSIGVAISQSWDNVGLLPNAPCTDDNTRGRAPMFSVPIF